MSKIQTIEKQVSELSPQELARFRAWYTEFDAASWDHQIEQDVATGKLDQLAEKALKAHASGKTSAL
ncbi:MAG TPA: hypothetical protein VFM15_09995 [Gammaproteobacteria bacterium]|nr:hypothetical protein [Gammaproteobacteria bacterium]